MILRVSSKLHPYDVIVGAGTSRRPGDHFDLSGKVLIVTDEGVPQAYSARVAAVCGEPVTVVLPQGERSKSVENWQKLLTVMLGRGFCREDCVVAVGGGTVGDLAGFAAACYMRGIGFYSMPTTVLSQVDASIGGKTAIDLCGIKNAVGAFYPPKVVIVDPELTSTLPARQVSSGLAEALKAALTFDEGLFELFEREDPAKRLPEIVRRSLGIKKEVVERDEYDGGPRRALNFGHTLGHGVEAAARGELLHGECVALGMIPMCAPDVRARLIPVLKKLGLPTTFAAGREEVLRAVRRDKKVDRGEVFNAVVVNRIGTYEIVRMTFSELEKRLDILEM